MKLTIKKILIAGFSFVVLQSCVKKEVELQNLTSDSIDPSFAAPLGELTINLGRFESHFADDHFVYNSSTGLLEYVYPKELFSLKLSDMIQIPAITANASFGMPAGTGSTFTAGGAGTVVNVYNQNTVVFPMSNGEELGTISIKKGDINIDLSSDFRHSGTVDIVIPSLTKNGGAFNTTLTFNYLGGTPILVTENVDVSGYMLDMTEGNTTVNTSRFAFNAEITNSGAPITGSESFDFTVNINIDSLQEAKGYFGTFSNILAKDTTLIDFFEKISGTVHLADPRVELNIYNTSGIPVQTDFTGIFAPDNSVNVNLGGAGLTSIPTIVGATLVGDTGVTNHIIDNNNTSPTLTALIDEGPGEIIFDASSTTNPLGVTSNFVTCESKMWCDSKLVLPLNGWGNNFTFNDTANADIEKMLSVDSAEIENIEKVTLRMIVDNGLPIENKVQIYFADTNYVIIDSLFTIANGEDIIRKANVNFAVPVGDPNYGRVTSSVRKITDIVLDKARFRNLANSGAKKMIYKAKALTNEANTGKDVKFYPEYSIKIKLSGKVDFNYEIKP